MLNIEVDVDYAIRQLDVRRLGLYPDQDQCLDRMKRALDALKRVREGLKARNQTGNSNGDEVPRESD